MKKLLVILTIVTLSGCSYFVKYDSGEYGLLNSIVTTSELAKDCDKEAVMVLQFKMHELNNYSSNLPNNDAIKELNRHLTTIITEFYTRTKSGLPMSTMYCNTKFKVVHDTAQAIQKTAGSKMR